ncbi:MAG TPA: ribonuclease catalytic domain-containing protein [Burkholderiaceae bacterium]|nr:ribonuclease catalytic domain-containing protein [Burkholderiaceae bacterium]
MSHTDASLQVELDSGRRVKVKSAHVLLHFEAPEPARLLEQARALAAEVDPELAWEFAPERDFGFADLAREYFDPKPGAVQQAAMLLGLFEAPHYFRRVGKGVFHKASRETVQAALAAIERKKAQAAQVDAWAAELIDGRCAEPIRAQLYRILFKPDKNSTEYKAVVEAARRAQRSPLDLLRAAGAIESPYQFHWRRFLYEQFPHGTGFAEAAPPEAVGELPPADVQAFSIDDSATTEIDDALSVRGLGSGSVTLGIHIAAPALAIAPDSALDRIARQRLSTVYMPGHKITMLPDAVVQRFTLSEGCEAPALSLYVQVGESSLDLGSFETRIERLHVSDNLRHDRLDQVITEASLRGEQPADYRHAAELAFLFRLAQRLKAQREQVRGKPETFNRPDYNFRLEGHAGGEPDGSETVQITPRMRGAPLDLIVSELMILANSHWGGWLAAHNVPAIYRSQASLAPGVKVRMGTKPAPHAGIGVSQYSWATSPLRRYVDLVNQWQIVACVRHGRTAALAAPFKPRDASLFSIISSFDATYGAYNDFQQAIERYWALRWLQQHDVRELDATTMRDGLVRAETLPLVFRCVGTESLPRGTRVRAALQSLDALTLEVHAALVARLTGGGQAAADASDEDEAVQPVALQLAIDVDDNVESPTAPDTVAP